MQNKKTALIAMGKIPTKLGAQSHVAVSFEAPCGINGKSSDKSGSI
jgi:GDP-D-mannose dehydratase